MPKQNKPAVQRYHDRVAGRYDDIYDNAYWQWHDTLTWDHIKGHLPRDLSCAVLDLGCGTGKWAMRLAKSGYRVTCVDISMGMLERARRKFDSAGLSERAEFVRADLKDLSGLARASYGLALALGEPIGCCSKPPEALKQIKRRLVDQGVLIASFDNRLAALDFYLERGDVRELGRFLRTGLTHWLTRDRREQFPIHTYSPGELHKVLGRTGFDVLDMIGKSVLPMRRYRPLLAEADARRAWIKLEKRLWRDPAAMGRAAHLQVAARVRGKAHIRE